MGLSQGSLESAEIGHFAARDARVWAPWARDGLCAVSGDALMLPHFSVSL